MTARVSGVARPVGRFSELPLDEDHAPRTIREFDQVNTFVGIGAPPRAAVPTYARETHSMRPSNLSTCMADAGAADDPARPASV